MPYRIFSLAALVIAVAAAPSFAGEGEKAGKKGDRQIDPERKQRMLDEFDLDGDGKLSEDERAEARAKRGGRMKEVMQKFDADGDGKLSQEERATARAEIGGRRGEAGQGPRAAGQGRRGPGGGRLDMMLNNPQQAFSTLDADGDGVLSQSEFMTMVEQMKQGREQMRAQMGQRRGPRGAGRPGRAGGRPESDV